MSQGFSATQIDEFLEQEIDTIPHLEALLLAWKTQSRQWTVEEMADELYVDCGKARNILQDLSRRGFLAASEGSSEYYQYRPRSLKQNQLMEAVDAAYKKELVRISRLIHSKAAPGVRGFAQAFRFKKDRD